jgi:hypothetical protein
MGSWRSAVCSLARADSRRPSQLHRGDVVTLLNQEQLYDRHNFCPGPSPPRYYHSSPLTPNRKQLATQEGAHEFLSSLSPAQRSNLSSALQKIRSLPERELEAPSWKQLRLCEYDVLSRAPLHHYYITPFSLSVLPEHAALYWVWFP